eukprot:CAMPEP_0118932934 /NCGR_PEP_ID=MMETSP1169-20130426/10713_1 /TAXON_ID=36882 /ORGANISM="Pyramimonas obovata, Strain CCMP722" /LENGTH=309 /DNA_ID=CAMNT_0006875641 /DNA_START=95 /DNA_END=1028 /DNA_ORIENTATION=+
MTSSVSVKSVQLAAFAAATPTAGRARRTCAAVPNCKAPTAWYGSGVTSRRGAGVGKSRWNVTVAIPSNSRRQSGVTGRGALQVVGSSSDDVFTINLSTEDARRTILLEQYVREDGTADVYCAGVGVDCEAGKQGLEPGMVLRSLSDPVKKGEEWVLTDNEKLRFVKDAIKTTRQYDFSLTFDKKPTITMEMVAAAQQAEQEVEEAPYVDGRIGSAAGPQKKDVVDRPDLYSDNWDGDVYVGSGWNELSVGLAIAIAVPVLGLIFALSTKGTLWGVVSFYEGRVSPVLAAFQEKRQGWATLNTFVTADIN